MEMQASSFKLQPPTFNSKKEEWNKFLTDSYSYAIIQGGEGLADHLLGHSQMDPSIIHHPHSSDELVVEDIGNQSVATESNDQSANG